MKFSTIFDYPLRAHSLGKRPPPARNCKHFGDTSLPQAACAHYVWPLVVKPKVDHSYLLFIGLHYHGFNEFIWFDGFNGFHWFWSEEQEVESRKLCSE